MRPTPAIHPPPRRQSRRLRPRPGPLRRHRARLHRRRRRAPRRLLPHPPHAGRDGRAPAVAPAEDRALRQHAGRADRHQAVQQVKAGLQAIYLSGWQVAADANTAGQMYPDQSLYPVDSVPNVVRRINAALRRCDQIAPLEGDTSHLLDGADRRRCRGRVRRRAERLRADARHDRGRRRRRAFRGPAGRGEEMRPSRRQGAGADQPAHPHPERRPPGRRRRGRADRAALPHRRAFARNCSPRTSTSATARSSPASARRRASSASARAWASSTRSPAAWPTRPMPTCCGGRPASPTSSEAQRLRRGDPPAVPGQAAGLQLLAQRSTGSARWRSPQDRRRSSARSAAMGYRFQFVTLAGFHSLNHVHVHAGARLPGARHGAPIRSCSRPSSPPRPTATPRRGTSARWGPATSTRWRRRLAAASPPPRRSPAAPRRRSSTTRRRPPPAHDHDDGLVHGHAWASAEHQPAK